MNILGLKITVNRDANARLRWTMRAGILAGAIGAVMSSGVAYAFWSTTGAGTGAASSGASQALTLTPGTTNANALYPNASGDVVIVVSNPNPFNVSLDSLTLPATAATAYTNAGLTTLNASCNSAGTGVTWSYSTKALSGVVVAKKTGGVNGTLTLTLTNGASMSNGSDNSCQSSFFKLPDVSAVSGSSTTAAAVATATQ